MLSPSTTRPSSPHEEAQLQQDLDSAREIQRARSNSEFALPPLPPSMEAPHDEAHLRHSPVAPATVLEGDAALLSRSPRKARPSNAHWPSASRMDYGGSAPPVSMLDRFRLDPNFRSGSFDSDREGGSTWIDHRPSQVSPPLDTDIAASVARSPQASMGIIHQRPHGSFNPTTAPGTASGGMDAQTPTTQRSMAYHSARSPGVGAPTAAGGGAGSLDPSRLSPGLSRPPSIANAEDDVCFPLSPPGLLNNEKMDDHTAGETTVQYAGGNVRTPMRQGTQELPMNFPYSFDLSTLDEFARTQREKEADGVPIVGGNQRVVSGSRARSAHPNGAKSWRGPGVTSATDTYVADSGNHSLYTRRPRKYTPAEEEAVAAHVAPRYSHVRNPSPLHSAPPSAHTAEPSSVAGRYQRKLALFEDQVGTPPPPPPAGQLDEEDLAPLPNASGPDATEEASRVQANAHTSLLQSHDLRARQTYGLREDEDMPEVGSSHHGPAAFLRRKSGRQGMSRAATAGSAGAGGTTATTTTMTAAREGPEVRYTTTGEKQKPFRFAFYSNALNSTIHARELYELPAPGQTFADLLMGRPAPTETPVDRASQLLPETGDTDTLGGSAKHGSLGTNVARSTDRSAERDWASGGGGAGAGGEATGRPASVGPAGETRGANNAYHPGPSGHGPPYAGHPGPGNGAHMRTNQPHPPLGGGMGTIGGGLGGNLMGPGSTAAASAAVANGDGAIGAPLGGGSATTWWLDVQSPTVDEMRAMSKAFGIHPLTTEDILMEETREKIELFRNYYLVCFRSFDQDPYSPTYLQPLNMYIIVFREGTLSFHFRATSHPHNVRRRIKQLRDYLNVGSDWISYALIDDITDAFGPLIQSIEYEVDSIDELVLILKEAEQSDMLRRIGTCRKKVMGLLRLMGSKADVVKGLAKRCNENWSVAPKSDIGLYLSDIQDHLITMTQNLNHYEKILSRSHSNYLAQISIEMTDANNQINDVLSKLTALGTVIVPLNIITGTFGMNVKVPGQQDEHDNLKWFAGICAVMCGIAVVGFYATLRYMKR